MDAWARQTTGWKACLADAWLKWLFLLALLLRVAFVFYHAATGWQLDYDPGMYLALARSMDHGAYSMFHPLDIPDTVKMPGYPALIWALRHQLPLLLGIQALLSAVKVPMVYAIAMRCGVRRPFALAAAALMAIDPMDVILAGQVLTEAVFTTLVAGGALMLLHRSTLRDIVIASFLFAAAAWVRPNGLPLLVIAGIAAVPLLHMPWRKAAGFIVCGVLLVVPWALRNQQLLGRFILGDGGTVAAAYFQVPHVLHAAGDPRAQDRVTDLMERSALVDWEDRQAVRAFNASLHTEVATTFMAYPGTWILVHARKALHILFAPGRGHVRLFFGHGPLADLVLIPLAALQVLLLLAAIPLLLLRFRRVPRPLWWMLILAAYLVVSGALAMTDARFRAPAMPFLLVAVAWTAQGFSRRPSGMDDQMKD